MIKLMHKRLLVEFKDSTQMFECSQWICFTDEAECSLIRKSERRKVLSLESLLV